jgi:hypothetical protein
MIRRTMFFVLALYVMSTLSYAGWVSLNGASTPQAPKLNVLSDDPNSTLIKIELTGFDVNDLVAGGRTYSSLDLLTDAVTTREGYPELPCVTAILAVPDNASISYEVVAVSDERSFVGYVMPPARPSWKEGDPEPLYVENVSAFQSVQAYPAEYATIDPSGVFRDFRIARIAVYPIRYVPSKKELRVATSITIRVKYESGKDVGIKAAAKRGIAPSFGAIYRSTILNYQSILDREFGGMENGRDVMLCISPDGNVNSLKPFVDWRTKTGTQVVVTKFSEIGANATNPDIIKNYIAQVYHSWQYPPTYVLLVGDYGAVPVKTITYDYTIVSENYFVEIDGNDFFPEIMIGRFTHDNDAGEQNIVNKIVSYERSPYMGNTAWFKKGAVACNNAYQSAVTTKYFSRDRMMLDGGFTSVDTFMNHNPCYSSLTDLINVVNNGRSFLNYRGEGWSDGWWASCYRFNTTNVSSLNNSKMLTFVTSIGCGVAMFNVSGANCFGEEWLELGTVAAPRGAVTFVGPTSNTHTTYNNKIDLGIYKGMFQEGLETPGQALMRGRMYMYSVFGNERWVEYQTRVYCILGDPSLHVWKDIPRQISMTYPSSIPIGYSQSTFTVLDSLSRVPVTNAEVCVVGDSIFTVGFTDANGNVTLGLTPEAIDTMTVLVRGKNVLPSEGSILVTSELQHVAPSGIPIVTDLDGNMDGKINPTERGQLTLTLKNWGSQTAAGVSATIATDTNKVQLLTQGPISFGNLLSGSTRTGAPCQFQLKPGCFVGDTLHFQIHVVSDSRSWDYAHGEIVNGCKLECVHFIVDDRSSARSNARMDPGETVKLYLTVNNCGEDVAANVRGVLRCSSPYITIADSVGSFGTMNMDSSVTNYGDFFTVQVSSSCPTRENITYSLLLCTQSGRYPYEYADTLSIPVALPRQSDPTGPDSYGYYAYVNDDTLYRRAPQYSWLEINGSGTEITRTSGDFTTTINLPFTFKYYGIEYTQIRVSTDGWIAFGSGTQTLAQNYPLPRNDNINCMVAAFWEDLFATSGETGKLIYYHDGVNRRFIIEWYNVGHRSDATKKETFQIALLNPTRYPTITGDGEILILYKNIADPGGNTVGLENHTQTVGLQYVYNEYYDESATPLRDTLAIIFTTNTPELLVAVNDQDRPAMPEEVLLEQNYPNPFNPTTLIRYQIPFAAHVTLTVFDLLGREVARLVDEVQTAGYKQVQFKPNGLASGIYFYRLQTDNVVATKKLVLLR